ncbi:MAG: hypothetical protein KDK25_09230 [Leptospiraceae bacterium]|nr:hypothetical protein [Leptospiraceae bacterium]MCB1170503.1 hypothetical protein [Leptospiraceae bacterium]
MQTVFKWIDKFFQSIPEGLARNIRLGSIGLWILLAGFVSYRACVTGQDEAPQMGQDLQLSRIKEQIVRDENRKNAPEIQLPDPDQILPESSAIDNLPLPEPSRDPLSTLPGSADLRERDPNPSSESLPPFLGETDEIIFPRKDRGNENPPSLNTDSDRNPPSRDLDMVPERPLKMDAPQSGEPSRPEPRSPADRPGSEDPAMNSNNPSYSPSTETKDDSQLDMLPMGDR